MPRIDGGFELVCPWHFERIDTDFELFHAGRADDRGAHKWPRIAESDRQMRRVDAILIGQLEIGFDGAQGVRRRIALKPVKELLA